jgi:hypothetical protein
MLIYRLPLAPKCRLRSGSNMPIADTRNLKMDDLAMQRENVLF